MSIAFVGSLELGLLYALMALGVYISFRILDFPDLTVDGSFTTGGAIAAILVAGGTSPWLATLAAFCGGLLAGLCTGLLNTKGRINALLSGIIMMIALYSINIRIMDMRANVSLYKIETLFTNANFWILVPIFILCVKLVLDWFFHTELGLALRATGDNKRMIQSFGVNTHFTIIMGIALSNGLVAVSGALVSQYSGFADVSQGVGMIVVGLASVIIGEALFGARTVFRATLAVIFGAVLYRLVIMLAMQIEWLESTDMKMITAFIVALALILPMLQRKYKQKTSAKRRTEQLLQQKFDQKQSVQKQSDRVSTSPSEGGNR